MVIVSRLRCIAIPMHGATMGTDTETMTKRRSWGGDIRCIGKVYAAICREIQVDDLFYVLLNRLDATNLAGHVHSVPDLMQLDTLRVFHNDVLTANRILRIFGPVQYLWYRYARLSLH